MRRALTRGALLPLVLGTLSSAAVAAPSAVPATLKTLESVLASVDIPTQGPGGGVKPLHGAVAAADALLRTFDPGGLSGAALEPHVRAAGTLPAGVLVGRKLGYPVVAGTVPGSPAFFSPLAEGDRILQVGEEPVSADTPLSVLEEKLAGKEDGKVTLRVLHEKDQRTSSVTLEFGATPPEVTCRVLTDQVAYVSLTGFSPTVLAEYTLHVGKLRGESLIGVVLDLRGAAGGKAQDAVTLVEPFLADATVATTFDGSGSLKTSGSVVTKVPMVVVVGAGTSGAAELAARALQANKRALVLGAATQGRALAYRQIQNGGAHLTLPETRYKGPGGTPVTGRGVTPDIEVAALPVGKNAAKAFGQQLRAFARGEKWEPEEEESEKEKALEDALGDSDEEETQDKDEGEGDESVNDPDRPADPFHDYPLVKRYDLRLVRSVHLLKAANIFFQHARSGD